MDAFDYADYYRNPALILGDGILAQMVEPVEISPYKPILDLPKKDYILDGCKGRQPRIVKSLFMERPDALIQHNIEMKKKYDVIQRKHQLCEEYKTDDAKLVVTGYGMTGRIAKAAVNAARAGDEGRACSADIAVAVPERCLYPCGRFCAEISCRRNVKWAIH